MPTLNILPDPGVTDSKIVIDKQPSEDVCIALRDAFDAADGS